MARSTYRDLCIAALRTSKAVGLDEDPGDSEIAYALNRLNGFVAQLFIDGTLPAYDINVRGLTYSDGKCYFGENIGSETQLTIDVLSPFTFSRLDRVIDVRLQRELIQMRESDYLIQYGQYDNVDHTYYTYKWISRSLIELQTSPVEKEIALTFKAMWTPVVLSTPFNLPYHYWDVIEYGLAALMGEFFDVDVSNVSNVFQSYVKNLKAMNFEMPIMNATRNKGNFYTGWM